MARRIILDVDTGTDDAIAIMMAASSKDIELVALCSVFGNASVENTTLNTLMAAHAAGADDIPVYPGASKPLVKHLHYNRSKPVDEPVLKGGAVIDGKFVSMNPDTLPLDMPERKPEAMNAACFYVDFLRNAQQKLTLVATGTLTNLALALIMAPDIVENIDEIVIMGGGVYKTNITASAEANFFKDPEAAKTVLNCGARITICTLDSTHSSALDSGHEERIRAVGTIPAVFCANDIRARIESYNKYQPLQRANTAPIHDALCIAYLIDPSVLTDVRHCSCDVECSDGICDGRLVVDMRHYTGERNVFVAFKADPDKFADLLVRAFSEGR